MKKILAILSLVMVITLTSCDQNIKTISSITLSISDPMLYTATAVYDKTITYDDNTTSTTQESVTVPEIGRYAVAPYKSGNITSNTLILDFDVNFVNTSWVYTANQDPSSTVYEKVDFSDGNTTDIDNDGTVDPMKMIHYIKNAEADAWIQQDTYAVKTYSDGTVQASQPSSFIPTINFTYSTFDQLKQGAKEWNLQ